MKAAPEPLYRELVQSWGTGPLCKLSHTATIQAAQEPLGPGLRVNASVWSVPVLARQRHGHFCPQPGSRLGTAPRRAGSFCGDRRACDGGCSALEVIFERSRGDENILRTCSPRPSFTHINLLEGKWCVVNIPDPPSLHKRRKSSLLKGRCEQKEEPHTEVSPLRAMDKKKKIREAISTVHFRSRLGLLACLVGWLVGWSLRIV